MNVSSLMGKHISVLTDKSSAVQGQALRQALELMGATTHPTVSKNNDKIVMLIYSSDQSCKTLMQQARKLKSRYPFVAIPAYEFPLDNQQLSVPKSADCISVPFELNAILETLIHLKKLTAPDNSLTNARKKRASLFFIFLIVALFPIVFCAHLYPFNKTSAEIFNSTRQSSNPTFYPNITLIGYGHPVNGMLPQQSSVPATTTDHNQTINLITIILSIVAYVILLSTTLIGYLNSCRRCRQLKGIEKVKHYLETSDDDDFEKDNKEAIKRKQKAQNHLLEFYLEESER